MTPADFAPAMSLTDLEGWGYTREDFRRLLDLEPDGCFVGDLDGKLVGVTCSTTYGKLAFVGAVIVDPAHRGSHVGRALMDATLDHLDSVGVETVRLNAYLEVVPFYERLGFRGEYEVVRVEGMPPGSPHPEVRSARSEEISALAAMDAPLFGASREKLLRRLHTEHPENVLVKGLPGDPEGFSVVFPGHDSTYVGPCVVRPGEIGAALDLLRHVAATFRDRPIGFAGPLANPGLQQILGILRLKTVFRTRRMVRGRRAHGGDPRGIVALAGLEKG